MVEPEEVRRTSRQPDRENDQALHADARIQRIVNERFRSETAFWGEIYDSEDVLGLIAQRRREVALEWIDELQLPPQSRILEVGCGAGLTAVELAKRGFRMDAIDTVPEMVELSRRNAEKSGVSSRLEVALGDVHALDFVDDTFDVVIAMGVIPWLHSPQTAIVEVARVLKPDAHFITTANNRNRLPFLLDPLYNPALRPLRKAVKRILVRLGVRSVRRAASPATHSVRELDALLRRGGLRKVTGRTIGFGPMTFLGRSLLPQRLQRRLHHWLQLRADRGAPGIRTLGAQYLVLARRAAA